MLQLMIMFRVAVIVCLGLSQHLAHAVNVKPSTAPPAVPEDQLLGTQDGDPRKIVINSESTSIQVSRSGKPYEHEDISELRAQLSAIERRMDAMALLNTQMETQLAAQQTHVDNAGGSVYVRWGGESCPESAEMMYSGVIGGSSHDSNGAAANALCLPLNPVYDDHPLPQWGPTHLYGAEYEIHPKPKNEQDPLCAVCLSPRPYTVMVPATNTCQPGWTVEYTGYIMASWKDHPSATEFLCMDARMDTRIGSDANNNGNLFYYTVSKCGSLPCPPYQNDKIVTCVVCSKSAR